MGQVLQEKASKALRAIVPAVVMLSVFSASHIVGQPAFPQTVYKTVTFYDFHSDGSNPEFESMYATGSVDAFTGMVNAMLDAERKPVLGSNIFYNADIGKWFRSWQAGDFSIPQYGQTELQKWTRISVGYDTAFKNIVIHDTLPFSHQGDGVYTFERSGKNETSEFFWLDNQGFGKEGRSHNFSFTMEMHTTFTYTPGLSFNFIGDDDVWAFVNNQLVMDLGGMHTSIAGSFNVDTIAAQLNLEPGKTYPFDFFYAERHTNNSTIKITTNLFTPMKGLQLYPKSGAPDPNNNPPLNQSDTAIAGTPFNVYAHVFDSTQTWRPEFENNVTWTMTDTAGKTVLSSNAGASTSFTPTEAYGWVTVTATYTKVDGLKINQSVKVYIAPGSADHISIQNSNLILDKRNDQSLTELIITEQQKTGDLYAVVRDPYGNYVGPASGATWTSANQDVVTVAAASGSADHGIVSMGRSSGSTMITVSQAGLGSSSVTVVAGPAVIIDRRIVARLEGRIRPSMQNNILDLPISTLSEYVRVRSFSIDGRESDIVFSGTLSYGNHTIPISNRGSGLRIIEVQIGNVVSRYLKPL